MARLPQWPARGLAYPVSLAHDHRPLPRRSCCYRLAPAALQERKGDSGICLCFLWVLKAPLRCTPYFMAPQSLFIAAPMGKANLDSQTTQPNKSPAGLKKRGVHPATGPPRTHHQGTRQKLSLAVLFNWHPRETTSDHGESTYKTDQWKCL